VKFVELSFPAARRVLVLSVQAVNRSFPGCIADALLTLNNFQTIPFTEKYVFYTVSQKNSTFDHNVDRCRQNSVTDYFQFQSNFVCTRHLICLVSE